VQGRSVAGRAEDRDCSAKGLDPVFEADDARAAAGVGAAYAVIADRQGEGADVVAGVVETYGRPLTEALLSGLEIIPRQAVDYRGTRLAHLFRTDNLIALRELALRFVADESDEQLLGYLGQQPQVLRETTERIMAAITTAPGTDAVLRRAARIAPRYKAELEVVHVIVDDTGLSGERQPIDGLRALAADLGARWHEIQQDDPARAIVGFAQQHEITQILIGPINRSWPHIAVGGRIVRRVFEEAGASGIDVLIIARRELPAAEVLDSGAVNRS
jgi:two-component system, OmpR family, sensor histidine kinase KdpD